MNTTPARNAARSLERLRQQLVEETVDEEFRARPDFWAKWGPVGRQRCLEDTSFHISFLVSALTMNTPGIFRSYTDWLVGLLERHGMDRDDVAENYRCLREAVERRLPPEEAREVAALLEPAPSTGR